MAHVLDKVRAARIMTYDLIQEACLSPSSLPEDSLKLVVNPSSPKTSAMGIRDLVTDICATIPMCYRPSCSLVMLNSGEDRPPLGTTYWLFWPLEVVGMMRAAPLELTDWTRQCFERMYDVTGIMKAQIAARRIHEKISRPSVA